MAEKEFDAWNHHKKVLHAQHSPFFNQGQVWWCGIGCNIGYEQDGKGNGFLRPVLVIRKFNNSLFVGVPFSTQLKENPYYYNFIFKGKQQAAILSQAKPMDSRRLHKLIGELHNEEVMRIKQKIINVIYKN